MKKTFYIFFLMISTLHFAQGTANPFEESEKGENGFESRTANQNNLQTPTALDGPTGNIGNPADPAPIDDYIPLLVLTALGIIMYTTRKKRNLLS